MIILRERGIARSFNCRLFMRKLRNRLIAVTIVQGVLCFLLYGMVAIPLNAGHLYVGGEESLAKLREQREILQLGPAWFLFGVWNVINLRFVDYIIQEIQSGDPRVPLFDATP